MTVSAALPILQLYGHAYCSLCTLMREQLASWPVELRWIDIEGNEPLEARFGELVPVLCGADGREICHYHLDSAALDAYLADFR
ncbi:glutaredoxin family protein [Chitinilyticum litopenaei]|uniref:glutaredoxin family protein n=1 Tax=Chitinilyticum litopenaei TaxID=1121276 RepID=UPI00040DA5C9|nr:glutaredoxin family protein [Chitinilyticum litopenaei]